MFWERLFRKIGIQTPSQKFAEDRAAVRRMLKVQKVRPSGLRAIYESYLSMRRTGISNLQSSVACVAGIPVASVNHTLNIPDLSRSRTEYFLQKNIETFPTLFAPVMSLQKSSVQQ